MTIVFRNQGVIPIEAFTIVGAHAKPNSDNPIGRFGSGLKYAVAVTLRLGGTFRLWRGRTEYEFYTKDEDFRGTSITSVRMRKRNSLLHKWSYHKLPFTTDFGKDWEPWQAVRELESNTRDEGGESFWLGGEGWHGENGSNETVIRIDCEPMEEAYRNLDTIFLNTEGRKLIHETPDLKIWSGSSKNIFYRGIRVTDCHKPTMFTYEFKKLLGLTEDRTSKYPSYDAEQIRDAILAMGDEEAVRAFLNDLDDSKWEGGLSFDTVDFTYRPTSKRNTFMTVLHHIKSAGVPMQPRIGTMYEKAFKEPDRDPMLAIEMKKSEWASVLDDLENCHDRTEASDTLIAALIRLVDRPETSDDEMDEEAIPY